MLSCWRWCSSLGVSPTTTGDCKDLQGGTAAGPPVASSSAPVASKPAPTPTPGAAQAHACPDDLALGAPLRSATPHSVNPPRLVMHRPRSRSRSSQLLQVSPSPLRFLSLTTPRGRVHPSPSPHASSTAEHASAPGSPDSSPPTVEGAGAVGLAARPLVVSTAVATTAATSAAAPSPRGAYYGPGAPVARFPSSPTRVFQRSISNVCLSVDASEPSPQHGAPWTGSSPATASPVRRGGSVRLAWEEPPPPTRTGEKPSEARLAWEDTHTRAVTGRTSTVTYAAPPRESRASGVLVWRPSTQLPPSSRVGSGRQLMAEIPLSVSSLVGQQQLRPGLCLPRLTTDSSRDDGDGDEDAPSGFVSHIPTGAAAGQQRLGTRGGPGMGGVTTSISSYRFPIPSAVAVELQPGPFFASSPGAVQASSRLSRRGGFSAATDAAPPGGRMALKRAGTSGDAAAAAGETPGCEDGGAGIGGLQPHGEPAAGTAAGEAAPRLGDRPPAAASGAARPLLAPIGLFTLPTTLSPPAPPSSSSSSPRKVPCWGAPLEIAGKHTHGPRSPWAAACSTLSTGAPCACGEWGEAGADSWDQPASAPASPAALGTVPPHAVAARKCNCGRTPAQGGPGQHPLGEGELGGGDGSPGPVMISQQQNQPQLPSSVSPPLQQRPSPPLHRSLSAPGAATPRGASRGRSATEASASAASVGATLPLALPEAAAAGASTAADGRPPQPDGGGASSSGDISSGRQKQQQQRAGQRMIRVRSEGGISSCLPTEWELQSQAHHGAFGLGAGLCEGLHVPSAAPSALPTHRVPYPHVLDADEPRSNIRREMSRDLGETHTNFRAPPRGDPDTLPQAPGPPPRPGPPVVVVGEADVETPQGMSAPNSGRYAPSGAAAGDRGTGAAGDRGTGAAGDRGTEAAGDRGTGLLRIRLPGSSSRGVSPRRRTPASVGAQAASAPPAVSPSASRPTTQPTQSLPRLEPTPASASHHTPATRAPLVSGSGSGPNSPAGYSGGVFAASSEGTDHPTPSSPSTTLARQGSVAVPARRVLGGRWRSDWVHSRFYGDAAAAAHSPRHRRSSSCGAVAAASSSASLRSHPRSSLGRSSSSEWHGQAATSSNSYPAALHGVHHRPHPTTPRGPQRSLVLPSAFLHYVSPPTEPRGAPDPGHGSPPLRRGACTDAAEAGQQQEQRKPSFPPARGAYAPPPPAATDLLAHSLVGVNLLSLGYFGPGHGSERSRSSSRSSSTSSGASASRESAASTSCEDRDARFPQPRGPMRSMWPVQPRVPGPMRSIRRHRRVRASLRSSSGSSLSSGPPPGPTARGSSSSSPLSSSDGGAFDISAGGLLTPSPIAAAVLEEINQLVRRATMDRLEGIGRGPTTATAAVDRATAGGAWQVRTLGDSAAPALMEQKTAHPPGAPSPAPRAATAAAAPTTVAAAPQSPTTPAAADPWAGGVSPQQHPTAPMRRALSAPSPPQWLDEAWLNEDGAVWGAPATLSAEGYIGAVAAALEFRRRGAAAAAVQRRHGLNVLEQWGGDDAFPLSSAASSASTAAEIAAADAASIALWAASNSHGMPGSAASRVHSPHSGIAAPSPRQYAPAAAPHALPPQSRDEYLRYQAADAAFRASAFPQLLAPGRPSIAITPGQLGAPHMHTPAAISPVGARAQL